MALIKCPECGKEVSDKAKKCIHCGQPLVDEVAIIDKVKCSNCGNIISDDAPLVWKCTSCNKAFKVSLSKLKKIYIQKSKPEYVGRMLLKCPTCGMGMDDGNEKIAYKCPVCENVMTGNLKYFAEEKQIDYNTIICPECGKKISDKNIIAWKCNTCGKAFKVSKAQLQNLAAKKKLSSDQYLLKCPTCKNGMDDGNESIAWKCSCGKMSMVRLREFGENVDDLPKSNNLIKCPECGKELIASAKFCNICGCPINKPTKRKGINREMILFLILFVITIIIIVAGGLYFEKVQRKEEQRIVAEINEKERQEFINEYCLLGQELYEEITSAKIDFNVLSSMFDTSSDLNAGLLRPTFFTDYVRGLCADNIINEKNIKLSIDRIKSDLEGLECEEPEVQELSVAIEDLYSAYIERYNLLVEGDFSANNFHNLDKTSKKNFDEKLTVVEQILLSFDLGNQEE